MTQATAIKRTGNAAKRYWNGLVAVERWAEDEITAGRQSSIVAAYRELLQQKALTGRAVTLARARASADHISIEEAINALRLEKATELDMIIRRKDGSRNRSLSRRRLAIEYATERIEATRKKKGSALPAAVAYAILQKFQASAAEYIRGKRKRPRFKKAGDSVSLQAQITSTTPYPFSSERGTTFVDLARIGGEVCAKVPVVFHRELPPESKIKQVALTFRGDRIFVVLMIEAPEAVLEKQFPGAEGRVAGIDPGRKVALSVSTTSGDQNEVIQPSLAKDVRFLRKLRRLQRKADRQCRAGNPDCFDAEGRWIRGKRLVNRSRNSQRTEQRIAELQRHLADARLDFYHRTANNLLHRFDAIGIGKWRGRGRAPAEGRAKRAQNRKDYDHAISLFAGILRYKAGAQKRVLDISEHGSTRDCNSCGEPTGPRGIENLKIRQWVCSNCGASHDRDFAAARAIARRVEAILAAEAHSPSSQDQSAKSGKIELQRRRSRKDQTKVASQHGAEVPVADEAQAARRATQQTLSATSAVVPDQLQRGARASLKAVAQEVSNNSLGGHPRQTANRGLPLAACAVEDAACSDLLES